MSEELPKGWVEKPIEEIADINPRHPTGLDLDMPVTFVPMAGVSEIDSAFKCTQERLLRDVKQGFTHFAEGDVLFAKITPCMENGKAAVAAGLKNGLGCGSTEFHVMRPHPGIESKYLYHFIHRERFRREAASNFTGTAGQARVPVSFIREAAIPVAPSPEQKRILEKLDALLSRVDGSNKRLERIPVLLKRFRQSVLAAACSGRLTADWREEHGEQPWQEVTLNDLIQEKPKNGYSAKPVKYETPYRVLTLTATTSGTFDPNQFKYFDEPIPTDSPLWLQPDDVIVQRGNTIEYVGVPAIYDGPPNQFVYPDLMIRFRANKQVTTKYLYLALSWDRTRNYLRERATGTAGSMPKINQQVLITTPINVPPLHEQIVIVKRVEALFKLADEIQQRYEKGKIFVNKLTQSILAKAFRGELVPQDPNDRPAERMLERLQLHRCKKIKPWTETLSD